MLVQLNMGILELQVSSFESRYHLVSTVDVLCGFSCGFSAYYCQVAPAVISIWSCSSTLHGVYPALAQWGLQKEQPLREELSNKPVLMARWSPHPALSRGAEICMQHQLIVRLVAV